jgi:hypothetical protein
MGTGFDSGNGEPLRVSLNRKFRISLSEPLSKSMGFRQSKLKLVVGKCILKILQKLNNCGMKWISNVSVAFKEGRAVENVKFN